MHRGHVRAGVGSFFGPIAGPDVFIFIRAEAQQFTEYWYFMTGLVLFLIIVFEPEGVAGIAKRGYRRANELLDRGEDR